MQITGEPPDTRPSMDLCAELSVGGVAHPAVLHRLSQFGAFVRCDPEQFPGAEVDLAVSADGDQIGAACTIAYRIGAEEASKLGTVAGLGLRFCDPFSRDAERFAATVGDLLAGNPLVAQPTRRIRDTALTSLRAAGSVSSHVDRPVFAGSLVGFDVPTLLSLLESTRKTGRLVLVRGLMTAIVDFSEGQIVGVRSTVADDSPATILRIVTEWKEGTFELESIVPQPRAVGAAPRLSVTQLLLEHALEQDELARNEAAVSSSDPL